MDPATDPVTGRPAAPHTPPPRSHQDPDAIANDIRETRAELDETIDAIGAKLDPSRLAHEAKAALTAKAHDLVDQASGAMSGAGGGSITDALDGNRLVETVKANPLPAAAVGLSVAWFLSKLGESETDRYRRERYAGTAYVPPPRPPATTTGRPSPSGAGNESLADKASDAMSTVQDKASTLADRVGDAASDLGDRASDVASSVTGGAHDRAHDAGQSLQHTARQAESWLERQMRQNPLSVGAVALAAGALVGLSVPETDAEHELMGDQADDLKRQAAQVARDKADDLQAAAQDVADQVADKAEDVADKASDKADALADKAEQKADDVTSGSRSPGSSASTGSSVDLSTGSGTPNAGTTRPPGPGVGATTPDVTVDLTGTPTSSSDRGTEPASSDRT